MKAFWIFTVLLLLSLSFAANWTDDGNGGVYWTENNYKISAYPATSNQLINHYQYVNFTSTNPANINVNLSFVFDQQPQAGDVLLWQNITYQERVQNISRAYGQYTIPGVINFTPSTMPCYIGDDQNTFKYYVTYNPGNGTNYGVACFNNYTQSGSNYTIFYSYNSTSYYYTTKYKMDWGSILTSFIYTNISNHAVYTINNVPFNGSTIYETKFLYSFPIGTNGKFDIYAHSGSPTDVINGNGIIYVQLDPWWNSAWSSMLSIPIATTVPISVSVPIAVTLNSTYCANSTLINQSTHTNIRFTDSSDMVELPYDYKDGSACTYYVYSTYAPNNATSIHAYLGNINTTSGENVAGTWANGYSAVWNGESYTDAIGGVALTPISSAAIVNNSGCIRNPCFNSPDGNSYLRQTSAGLYDNLTSADGITLSTAYYYNGGSTASHQNIIGQGMLGYAGRWGIAYPNTGVKLVRGVGVGTNIDTTALNLNSLEYQSIRVNATVLQLGRNTTFSNTTGGALDNSGGYFTVGSDYANTGGALQGYYGEIRLSHVARSDQYIKAEYQGYGIMGNITESSTTTSSINVYQITPISSTILTSQQVNFTYTVNLSSSFNTTVKLYSDNILVQTNTTTANTTFKFTQILPDGNHNWYIFAYNTTNQSFNTSSSLSSYSIDTEFPYNVTFSSPISNSSQYYLNVTYNISFINNGSFKNCTLFINSVGYVMTNTSAITCTYNLINQVINATYYAQVCDLAGNCNTSTPFYLNTFNYSVTPRFDNPQYDLQTSQANLTFTIDNYFGDITANVTYNGSFSVGNRIGNIFYFNLIPPISTITSTQTITWAYSFTNDTFSSTFSNTTTLYPSGLMACGGLSNITSINYTVLDSVTLTPISAAFSATILQSYNNSKVTTISYTNNTQILICIYPNSTVTATINESFSAVGYYSLFNTRLSTTYSNSQTNIVVYMTNTTSGAKQTIIQVVDNNLQPIAGVFVKIEQQNTSSGSFYQIILAPTNANGETTQTLIPNSVFYRFSVLSSNNTTLATYAPQIVSCGIADASCLVTLTVGQIIEIPYVSTFGFTNASCTWVNTTGTLSCTPSGIAPTSTLLTVTLINSTAYNSSICTQVGVGSATVTCILPTDIGNCYNFAFSANLTTGETPQLGGGQVCIAGKTVFIDRSGIGLILTFVLVGMLGLIGLAFGPSGACVGASFGLLIAIAFGVFTGMAFYGGIMGVLLFWVIAWTVR